MSIWIPYERGKMNKNKKLIKNSAIFAIGNIGSKLIGFLLLPYYTYLLTSKQYGEIDLIMVTVDLIWPILSFNIMEGVFRFTLDKNYKNEEVFSTSIIIAICTFLFGGLLYPFIKNFERISSYIELLYLLVFFLIIQSIVKIYVRAKERLDIFIYSDFIQIVIFVILNIILIGKFKLGVTGYILARLISVIIEVLYIISFGKIYKDISIKYINISYCRILIKYCIPLIPVPLMWWIMSLSDRYLITYFIGVSSTGIYGIACKFPTIVSQITSIFFKAWQISMVQEFESKDASDFSNKVFEIFSCFIILASSFMMLVIRPIAEFILGNEFKDVWIYVPFLVVSTAYYAFSGFLGTNYVASKKTKGAFYTSFISSIVNIVMNMILIPIMGIQGACISTMFSYMILFYARVRGMKKIIEINYSNKFKITISLILVQAIVCVVIRNIYIMIFIQVIICFVILCFNYSIIKNIVTYILKSKAHK